MQKKRNQKKVTRKNSLGVLLLLTLFVISSFCINCRADEQTVEVNKTNFPSIVFRKYIFKNIDKNYDDELSQKEMEKVKYISLWKSGKNGVDSYKKVDLKGINYFKNLKELNAYAQDYQNLELLSRQEKLKDICFYSDEQKEWEIPEIKSLKNLTVDDEDIQRIDLSKNSQLEKVKLINHSNRKLKLNLRENKKLKKIDITSKSKRKTKLDFSNNNRLEAVRLDIRYGKIVWPEKNRIKRLKISNREKKSKKLILENNKKLQELYIYNKYNSKMSFDFSENIRLRTVHLNTKYSKIIWPKKNYIKELKITNRYKKNVTLNLEKNTRLKELYVNNKYNSKMSFDFSKNKKLRTVHLNTQFSKIIGPEKGKIKSLCITVRQKDRQMVLNNIRGVKKFELEFNGKNNIEKLMVLGCPNLESVYIYGKGKLKNIELSQLNNLEGTFIEFGKSLKQINFADTENVDTLVVSGKKIEKMNINYLKKLQYINVEHCGIRVVDLRNLSRLKSLSWNKSNCRTILFANNTKLERVDISRNKLTGALDLSDMKRLWNFYCDHNKITEIYASKKLKEFNDLSCEYNNLKKLNFYNTYVERIYAKHNPTLKEVYLRDDGGADFHFDKGVKKHYKEK